MDNAFICESESPVCDGLEAVVIRDDNAYYFSLIENFGGRVIHMLWLCNRIEAPDDWDTDRPGSLLLPRRYITHDPAGMELDETALRIVWYASGDCAALFYRDSILAAIPPFAVMGEFTGYSKYVREQNRYGAPLTAEDEQTILTWLNFANKQWRAIASPEVWEQIDTAYREIYGQFAGEPTHYFHMQEDRLSHRRLWMGKRNGICYNLTVGMAQLELPYVWHLYGKEFAQHARMELGFACREEYEQTAMQMVPIMDMILQMPWRERDYLGHGHTIDLHPDAIPGYAGLLLLDASQIKGMPCPPLPVIMNSPVRLHWLVPVRAQEMESIRSGGEKGLKQFLRKVWFPEAVHIFNG